MPVNERLLMCSHLILKIQVKIVLIEKYAQRVLVCPTTIFDILGLRFCN